MGSAARFVVLLAIGVVIVVLYVRTGESFVVLALSLLTLLVGLVLVDRRPWVVEGGEGTGGLSRPGGAKRGGDGPPAELRWDDTWRCGHDVVWDRQGVRAVAVGDRLPGLTLWSRIDRISIGRFRAVTDDRGPQRRHGIHLELYRPAGALTGPAGPSEVWLCLGPDQDAELLVAELTRAWRRAAAVRTPGRPDQTAPRPERRPRPDRGPKPSTDR